MICAYQSCSCTPETCEGKRRKAPLKPWGKFCCLPCGNRSRMANYYRRRTLASGKKVKPS